MFRVISHKVLFSKYALFSLLLALSIFSYSQNVSSEYSNFDCSKAKQITIPFSTTNNSFAVKNATTKNQIVFYEYRDQFSYWYKLICTEDRLVGCKITPINKNDSYALY